MPRVKQSKIVRHECQTTSADPTTVPPFEAGVPDASGAAPEASASAPEKVGPKKVRAPKVKPCVRCEERRARERQYAKSSRLRLRAAAAAAPKTAEELAAAASETVVAPEGAAAPSA